MKKLNKNNKTYKNLKFGLKKLKNLVFFEAIFQPCYRVLTLLISMHFVLSKAGVKCGLRTLPKPARRGKMRTGSANLVRTLPLCRSARPQVRSPHFTPGRVGLPHLTCMFAIT